MHIKIKLKKRMFKNLTAKTIMSDKDWESF